MAGQRYATCNLLYATAYHAKVGCCNKWGLQGQTNNHGANSQHERHVMTSLVDGGCFVSFCIMMVNPWIAHSTRIPRRIVGGPRQSSGSFRFSHLLQARAETDAQGRRPLHWAAEQGCEVSGGWSLSSFLDLPMLFILSRVNPPWLGNLELILDLSGNLKQIHDSIARENDRWMGVQRSCTVRAFSFSHHNLWMMVGWWFAVNLLIGYPLVVKHGNGNIHNVGFPSYPCLMTPEGCRFCFFEHLIDILLTCYWHNMDIL